MYEQTLTNPWRVSLTRAGSALRIYKSSICHRSIHCSNISLLFVKGESDWTPLNNYFSSLVIWFFALLEFLLLDAEICGEAVYAEKRKT